MSKLPLTLVLFAAVSQMTWGIPLKHNFSGYKPEALRVLLVNDDVDIRVAALYEFACVWTKEVVDGKTSIERKETDEVDPSVSAIINLLKANPSRAVGMRAVDALARVPSSLANPNVVRKVLIATSTTSENKWVRVSALIALKNSFWLRGAEIDDTAVKCFAQFLSSCKDAEVACFFLKELAYMKSDCLPFSAAIEELVSSPNKDIAADAKKVLGMLALKMDAEERKRFSASGYSSSDE